MIKFREKAVIFILITLMVIALIPVEQSTYAQANQSFEVEITDVDVDSKRIEVSEIEEGITEIGLFLNDENIQTKAVSEALSFTVYENGTYELRGFDANNEQKSKETVEVKTFSDSTLDKTTTESPFTITAAGIITAYDGTKNSLHPIVDIPQTINSIAVKGLGNNLFLGKNIESLVLPEGLETIGENAVEGNALITEIKFPSTLKSIGQEAFASCLGLKEVAIPEGVTAIGQEAFVYCHGLKAVKIPSTITTLNNAFIACSMLERIELPSTLTSIDDEALSGSANGIKIFLNGKSVNEITGGPWEATGAQIYWENSLNGGSCYYADSSGLLFGFKPEDHLEGGGVCTHTSVDIPEEINGVTIVKIGKKAFIEDTRITEVHIPRNATEIGDRAFYGCKSIKKLTIDDGVETLGVSAFYRCEGLTSIELPETVTSLTNSVFMLCKNLKEVILPDSMATIGQQIFHGCASLVSINLPQELTSIGLEAFYECESLTEVKLPGKLETIGVKAFQYCGFTSMELPNSVKTIGTDAFSKMGTNGKYEKAGSKYEYKMPEDIDLSKVTITTENATLDKGSGKVTFPNRLLQLDYAYKVANDSASQDMSVWIKLDERRHIVTFLDFDGTVLEKIGKISTGDSVVMNTPPTRAGYIFIGWDKPLTNITQDTVITAQYEKVPDVIVNVTVTFKDYDGKILDTDVVGWGQDASTEVIPSRTGYTFIGWDKALTNIMENTTITALYKRLPTIKAEDVYLELNDPFDPLENVEATDADGNKITDVKVIKNTVDTSKEGSYLVIVQATDKWGGSTSKQYKVIVEEGYVYRVLKDKNTGITIEGYFSKNARLVVKLTPKIALSLSHKIQGKELINAFDVSIIGGYRGELRIKFPVDNQREGTLIYVYHEKNDGGIESFERNANNSFVEITVDELSPFVLAKDKSQQPETGDEAPLAMYILLGLTALLLFGIELRLKKNS